MARELRGRRPTRIEVEPSGAGWRVAHRPVTEHCTTTGRPAGATQRLTVRRGCRTARYGTPTPDTFRIAVRPGTGMVADRKAPTVGTTHALIDVTATDRPVDRKATAPDGPGTPTGPVFHRDTPATGGGSKAVGARPSSAPPPPATASRSPSVDGGDAFMRALYEDYGSLLLTVVSRLTGGDRHWAQDVVQETFLRAWRHADRLSPQQGSGSMMPWLATVARRIVSNDRRGRAVRPKEVNDACLAIAAAPQDESERVLHRVILEEALGTLTPAHRAVVVELYLHGRSVQEVADLLGVPAGTVKSRAFYAMRVMRATMKRRGVTL